MSNGANKPDPKILAGDLSKARKGGGRKRNAIEKLMLTVSPEELEKITRREVKAKRKLADAIAAAEPTPAPAPKSMEAAVGKLSKEEAAEFTDIITKAREAAAPKRTGFDITVGGEPHRVGPDAPVPMTTGLIPDAGGTTGAFGGGEFEIGSEVGDLTRTIDAETGLPKWENPTKATIAPSTFAAGAGIAGALLEGKEKRTELSKDFGKALRTGLETLTGEARQANVGVLRDEMVSQGLTTAENFNRVGRKMLKDVEDERKRAKIDFLRSPAGGTVAAPGLGKLEAMQGRAFGTSTALSGSVGRLGEAARPLGTVAGRMRKEARALERRGYRSGGGQLRGAAALTGEPGISTPAYREKQRAEEERTAALRKREEETRVLLMEEYERRNNERGKVNPRSTAGAGRGTPIKQ